MFAMFATFEERCLLLLCFLKGIEGRSTLLVRTIIKLCSSIIHMFVCLGGCLAACMTSAKAFITFAALLQKKTEERKTSLLKRRFLLESITGGDIQCSSILVFHCGCLAMLMTLEKIHFFCRSASKKIEGKAKLHCQERTFLLQPITCADRQRSSMFIYPCGCLEMFMTLENVRYFWRSSSKEIEGRTKLPRREVTFCYSP